MSRNKSKGNLKTFVFSIDASDPKYTDLVNYLESIDNGARSYVIRQILNSYLGNQCVMAPTTNTTVSQPQPVVEKQIVEETVPQQKTEKTNVVPKMTASFKPNNKNKKNNQETQPIKKEPVKEQVENNNEDSKKNIPSEGMSKLLQNFQ